MAKIKGFSFLSAFKGTIDRADASPDENPRSPGRSTPAFDDARALQTALAPRLVASRRAEKYVDRYVDYSPPRFRLTALASKLKEDWKMGVDRHVRSIPEDQVRLKHDLRTLAKSRRSEVDSQPASRVVSGDSEAIPAFSASADDRGEGDERESLDHIAPLRHPLHRGADDLGRRPDQYGYVSTALPIFDLLRTPASGSASRDTRPIDPGSPDPSADQRNALLETSPSFAFVLTGRIEARFPRTGLMSTDSSPHRAADGSDWGDWGDELNHQDAALTRLGFLPEAASGDAQISQVLRATRDMTDPEITENVAAAVGQPLESDAEIGVRIRTRTERPGGFGSGRASRRNWLAGQHSSVSRQGTFEHEIAAGAGNAPDAELGAASAYVADTAEPEAEPNSLDSSQVDSLPSDNAYITAELVNPYAPGSNRVNRPHRPADGAPIGPADAASAGRASALQEAEGPGSIDMLAEGHAGLTDSTGSGSSGELLQFVAVAVVVSEATMIDVVPDRSFPT